MNDRINQLLKEKESIVIAIDGMSGAGKTTYAEELATKLDANVIHMDDFFLPFSLRTKERYQTPGGNIHYERFKEEVINHLNKDFSYRKFDCHKMEFSSPICVKKKRVLIIEGAYALHPYFEKYYDLSIFMEINSKIQMERIIKRNPKNKEQFFSLWIPLENQYFKAYSIRKNCDFIIIKEG